MGGGRLNCLTLRKIILLKTVKGFCCLMQEIKNGIDRTHLNSIGTGGKRFRSKAALRLILNPGSILRLSISKARVPEKFCRQAVSESSAGDGRFRSKGGGASFPKCTIGHWRGSGVVANCLHPRAFISITPPISAVQRIRWRIPSIFLRLRRQQVSPRC